jgi:hypothetical protein
MKEFDAYSVGLVFASVCTSLSIEDATRRLNAESPTGVGDWMLHDGDFRTGESNPCPCDKAPETHKHMLFSC